MAPNIVTTGEQVFTAGGRLPAWDLSRAALLGGSYLLNPLWYNTVRHYSPGNGCRRESLKFTGEGLDVINKEGPWIQGRAFRNRICPLPKFVGGELPLEVWGSEHADR